MEKTPPIYWRVSTHILESSHKGMIPQSNVTQLLREASNGNRQSLDQLLPLVYQELRSLADSFMRRERASHTLQPTALVHEAYMRLIDQRNVNWKDRAHFMSIAAETMRRILVNHALAGNAAKRGGKETKVSIDEAIGFPGGAEIDFVLLDEALTNLASFDPRQSQIVELRFFGGLTVKEVARVTNLSTATVEREWRTAKAWLHDQIVRNDAG
jgi:RNA polymerase sigma-70 factor (ECF subfamily)